jgi:hypothetical protein
LSRDPVCTPYQFARVSKPSETSLETSQPSPPGFGTVAEVGSPVTSSIGMSLSLSAGPPSSMLE